MRWYFSRAEQYAVAVLLVAVVGALVVLGYAYGARSTMQAANGPLYTPQRQSSSSSSETMTSVTVHVTGAVVHGGTYTLDSNARINDALQAAGGPTEDGCPEAMNLAAHLQDGQKISLPTRTEWEKTTAETPPPLVENEQPRPSASAGSVAAAELPAETEGAAASTTSDNKPATPAKVTGDEKININTASYEELQRLPRVGPVMAQAIIDYRTKNGPITDYAQLLNIPRLGEKTLENLKPHITL